VIQLRPEETKAMANFYGTGARILQDKFDTRRLADKETTLIIHNEITDEDRAFIESRDMFFLATVDREGSPQCSYKGGAPGFVKVADNRTIAFPNYDGNGMFLSMGNILENSKIGMLFIDFENPQRLRLTGSATFHENDVLLSEYHEAQFIVRVRVQSLFVNCARYVHRFKRLEASQFVPSVTCDTPVPDWKTLVEVQDVLPARDLEKVRAERRRRGLS
jgi:predicted pyridoxine 5'-phosphate oxidase superfamily flavin-nucleotide-binding protein